jgi:hypothetical protein
MKRGAVLCGIGLIAVAAAVASIGVGYSLLGEAAYLTPGYNSNRAVSLTSSGYATYSAVDIAVPAGLKFSELAHLEAEFMVTAGDCGGGSPRFQVNVAGKNVQVYLGPAPNFSNCVKNTWLSTGDLIASPDLRFDTSQVGGKFYDNFAGAEAVVGNQVVTGIQLVVDGGWAVAGGTQTVVVDNIVVNDVTSTFEFTSKDDCKNGGWQNFVFAPGPFKNQGQCVSYFANGGK